MPIDYKTYPANWKREIVPAVRKRSGNRCEWPGCGARHLAWVVRGEDDKPYEQDGCHDVTEDERPIQIILTTAHIDHDISNNAMENLAHWCQLHHNRWDAKHRQANARTTRAKNKRIKDALRGQTFLDIEES